MRTRTVKLLATESLCDRCVAAVMSDQIVEIIQFAVYIAFEACRVSEEAASQCLARMMSVRVVLRKAREFVEVASTLAPPGAVSQKGQVQPTLQSNGRRPTRRRQACFPYERQSEGRNDVAALRVVRRREGENGSHRAAREWAQWHCPRIRWRGGRIGSPCGSARLCCQRSAYYVCA